MQCSLFFPPTWLTWYLLPIWPLIYWRIYRLKVWFHEAGQPGSQILWGVDRYGRVLIFALSDDLTGRSPWKPIARRRNSLCEALAPEAAPAIVPQSCVLSAGLTACGARARRPYTLPRPHT